MARVRAEKLSITISKLEKSNLSESKETEMLSNDIIQSIESITQELMGADVLVEVYRDPSK